VRFAKALPIALLFIMLSGCMMTFDIEQSINEDGSALVSESIDMSSLIEYALEMQGQFASSPPPEDDSYSRADYGPLALPEELDLELTFTEPEEELRVGDSAFFYFSLKNNGEAIEAASLSIYSNAFVSSSHMSAASNTEYISSLQKRESDSVSFYGKIANVSEGTHSLTVVIEFDRGNYTNLTAAKSFDFEVLPAETTEDMLAELEKNATDQCNQLMLEDPGISCSFDNYVFKLSKTIQPNSEYEFISSSGIFDTTYEVTIHSLPVLTDSDLDMLGGMGGLDSTSMTGASSDSPRFVDGLGDDSSGISSMAMVRSMIEITYTVHMPADIVEAPLGEISADKRTVTYDVLTLYEQKQPIHILAQQQNDLVMYVLYGVAALIALAILYGILSMFVLKRL